MTFVLIHGATCSAGTWGRLIPLLDGDVLAVDLPGRGTRAGIDLRGVTLGGCAQAVADDIVQRDMTDVVLVAHSFGGVVAPGVMALVPERIRQVILLSAVVPEDGTPLRSHIDAKVMDSLEGNAVGGVYAFDPDAIRAQLCSDADEDQVEFVSSHLVDDSVALLAENVDLAGYQLPIPRTYILLSQDQCYSPELQAQSARRTGAEVVTLASGHMGMATRPDQLAAILNDSLQVPCDERDAR
ncbi:alpha/beta hydrolase [Streptomyces sp. FXJ1.4098]|nr:alpha/beta hydrolase [Streptomyces sp. FXJ1.4098]